METRQISESLKSAQEKGDAARREVEDLLTLLRKEYFVKDKANDPDEPEEPTLVKFNYDPSNQALFIDGEPFGTSEIAGLIKYLKFLEETGLLAQLPSAEETNE